MQHRVYPGHREHIQRRRGIILISPHGACLQMPPERGADFSPQRSAQARRSSIPTSAFVFPPALGRRSFVPSTGVFSQRADQSRTPCAGDLLRTEVRAPVALGADSSWQICIPRAAQSAAARRCSEARFALAGGRLAGLGHGLQLFDLGGGTQAHQGFVDPLVGQVVLQA